MPRTRLIFLAVFVVCLAATGFFAARLIVHTVYWSTHQDEPIEPWMTPGYVAHSYDLEPQVLFEALDVPSGRQDRRTLARIAESKNVSFDEVRALIEAEIARQRAVQAAPPAGAADAPRP